MKPDPAWGESWKHAAVLLASAASLLAPDAKQASSRLARKDLLCKLEGLERRLRDHENYGPELLCAALPRHEEAHSAPQNDGAAGFACDDSAASPVVSDSGLQQGACGPQGEPPEQFVQISRDSPLIVRPAQSGRDSLSSAAHDPGRSSTDAIFKKLDAVHEDLAGLIQAGFGSAAAEIDALNAAVSRINGRIERNCAVEPDRFCASELGQTAAALADGLDVAANSFPSSAAIENAIRELSAQVAETHKAVAPIVAINREASANSGPSGGTNAAILEAIANLRSLHEENASRANFAWASVQTLLEQVGDLCARLEAAVRGKAADFQCAAVTPDDPFVPLLARLAPQPGENGLPGTAARSLRPSAGRSPHGVSTERLDEFGDLDMSHFLIEPDNGCHGLKAAHEPGAAREPPPAPSEELQAGASRPGFIAAASRAAQTSRQLETRGASGRAEDCAESKAGGRKKRAALFPACRGLSGTRNAIVLGTLSAAVALLTFALATQPVVTKALQFLPALVKQFYGAAQSKNPARAETAPAFGSRHTTAASPPSPTASQTLAPYGETSGVLDQPQQGTPHDSGLSSAALLGPLVSAGQPPDGAAKAGKTQPAERTIFGGDAMVAAALLPGNRLLAAPLLGAPRPASADLASSTKPEAHGPLFGESMPPASSPAAAPSGNPVKDLLTRAQTGDPAAQFELAAVYAADGSAAGNLALAVQWYEKAAGQGHAVAEYRLATLYEYGHGVAKDLGRAKELYQRAAEKGNIRAMHNLGVLAAEGSDGKPNYTSAALWFGKAAEYGVRDSQYNFAVLLARGLGITKDLVQSYSWFAVVAASGDEEAAHKRDEVAARLTSSEFTAASAAAAAFAPRTPDRAANEPAPPPAAGDTANPAPPPAAAKLSGL